MIGIDIVSINRLEKLISKYGDKALSRFLSPKEILLTNNKIQSIAGFWAAKEAISKALGTGIGRELSFLDIKIKKDSNNAPYFKIKKRIRQKYSIKEQALSITHDGGFAIAVAIIKKKKDKNNV